MAPETHDTGLVYGQNDVPPAGHLILLSLQQGFRARTLCPAPFVPAAAFQQSAGGNYRSRHYSLSDLPHRHEHGSLAEKGHT